VPCACLPKPDQTFGLPQPVTGADTAAPRQFSNHCMVVTSQGPQCIAYDMLSAIKSNASQLVADSFVQRGLMCK
jgi:hypothetical protein